MKRIIIRIPVLAVTLLNIWACHNKIPETKAKAPFCLTDTLQKKAVIDTVKLQIVKISLPSPVKLKPTKING